MKQKFRFETNRPAIGRFFCVAGKIAFLHRLKSSRPSCIRTVAAMRYDAPNTTSTLLSALFSFTMESLEKENLRTKDPAVAGK